jgi:O-antigen ligase
VHERWGRHADAPLLIVLAWAAVVLPRVVQSLDVDKRRATLENPSPSSTAAQLAELACEGALLLACLVVVLSRLGRLPVVGGGSLGLLLAPWVYTVLRSLYLGQLPTQPSQLLYPAVVLALWAAQPRLEQLALLGRLHALTVGISLALGVLLPDKGVYQSIEGGLVDPDKALLPVGILIGPFTDGNNLAQVLVLGLPMVAFLPSRGLRWAVGALTVLALVWTSSRSALAAAAVGGAVWLVLRRGTPLGRQLLSGAVLVVLAAAVAVLPLLTTRPDAFTNRGAIWQTSLSAWADAPLFGLGVDWYSASARFDDGLGGFAFHGHNQFVHVLVTGGIVGLLLLSLLTAAVIASATRWAASGVVVPAVYTATLLVTCLLEVSYGVVDRSFALAVVVVPLAVIAVSRPSPREPAYEGPLFGSPVERVALPGGAGAEQQSDDDRDREVESGARRGRRGRERGPRDGDRANRV